MKKICDVLKDYEDKLTISAEAEYKVDHMKRFEGILEKLDLVSRLELKFCREKFFERVRKEEG